MSIAQLLNKRSRENLMASTIQEMMALSYMEGVVSFTAGEPSPDQYPVEELSRAAKRVLKENGDKLLGYRGPQGTPNFKAFIQEWMLKRNYIPQNMGEENIIPTNGSQEGLNLISEAFLEDGDTVLTELPTYPEAMLIFHKDRANIVGVATDENGMIPEAVEEYIKKHPGERVKLLYTIPNFQNPTGITMSESRKKEIIKVAEKHNLVIIEDDPYGELRYEGKNSPSMLYHNNGERVVYLSTFSKLIAPGLRIGWMVIPSSILKTLLLLKGAMEIGLPSFIQEMVVKMAEDGYFDGKFKGILQRYKVRRDVMEDNLNKYIKPLNVHWRKPGGGFFFWLDMKGINNTYDFCFDTVKNFKVGLVPGIAFFPSNKQENHYIRLSFSKVKEEEIEEGIKRFKRALESYKKK
ncbi:MAG: PLP-dependent aminotransferase family protein [Synergistetes bacterium]|nr:PLP-dependent aminotransferase family protein [Synergistota bacterium]